MPRSVKTCLITTTPSAMSAMTSKRVNRSSSLPPLRQKAHVSHSIPLTIILRSAFCILRSAFCVLQNTPAMTWGDVQLHMEADGTEYLEHSERQTKTRTGAEPRNVRAVKPKAFAAPNGPPQRDPVAFYKIYSEKRPDTMNKPDAPYYLGINYTKSPSSNKLWFKSSAMGQNKLNSLMKTMAEKGGLSSKRLTNHGARKRMIQKLNDSHGHASKSHNAALRPQKCPNH